jgi:hypothetical protein
MGCTPNQSSKNESKNGPMVNFPLYFLEFLCKRKMPNSTLFEINDMLYFDCMISVWSSPTRDVFGTFPGDKLNGFKSIGGAICVTANITIPWLFYLVYQQLWQLCFLPYIYTPILDSSFILMFQIVFFEAIPNFFYFLQTIRYLAAEPASLNRR